MFPNIFAYLGKTDILQIRQLNKRCRGIVDEFLENHESRLPFDEKRSNMGHRSLFSILQEKKLTWNTFYERDQLVRFINLMGQPQTSPIIGKAIWLEFQEEEESEDENFQENSKFWPTVFQFLQAYGHHVWYFTIGTYGTRNTYSRFLYLLNTCLNSMPNLKSLHIFGWINEGVIVNDAEGDAEHVQVQRDLTMDEIPQYLQHNPLPVLPFLETLEIDNMSGLPESIQDHLITRHAEQLKCLQLSEWERSGLISDIKLPKLKELIVDVSRYRPMEKVAKLLTHLGTSPIGKMSLSFSTLESTLDMESLFELLGTFSSSLRSLRLTVVPGTPRRAVVMNETTLDTPTATTPLKLNAPHLQALHLEGFDQLPLTFLGGLASSLEYLELRPLSASIRDKCFTNEIIDLYQYLHCRQVYDSRVWVDLPKLKAIYFEICDTDERRFVDLFFSRQTFEYLEALKKPS